MDRAGGGGAPLKRLPKILYTVLGLVLLGFILGQTDLAEVSRRVAQVGWLGMAVILTLYFFDFLTDTLTWQMTVLSVPLDARWLYRFWKVRMVGEAFNRTLPAAGLGGEPMKAVLLKRHHGIGYREVAASLVLSRTINTIALILFLSLGYLLILRSTMPPGYKAIAGAGLAISAVGVGLFYLIQRLKLTSLAGTWLSRFRFARRLEAVMRQIVEIDEILVRFYSEHRGRFAAAVVLALLNWLFGVAEIWVALVFLGHPISSGDAWIAEAFAQLVRMWSFFIPGSVGAQEGAFFLVGSTLAGSGTLGVAVGVVRRVREVLWIAWGFALGYWLGRKDGVPAEPTRD